MRVYHSAVDAGQEHKGCVLTLGNLDGVHRGHAYLLGQTVDLAKQMGTTSLAMTFCPHPAKILAPGNAPPRILGDGQREQAVACLGIDGLVLFGFDRKIASLEPSVFIERYLRDALGVSALVVGYDFRFGRGRAGDAGLLRSVLGVPVHEVSAVTDEHGPLSSTRIRAAVARGDLSRAQRMLGRPVTLAGQVIRGDGRGHSLKAPTANLLPVNELLPPDGVYAVRACWDGRKVDAVAHLGFRPTFDGTQRRLEVHLLDGDYALYGQWLQVQMVGFVRQEKRFTHPDELASAIAQDVQVARAILAKNDA